MTTTPQPSQAFQSTATKPATNRELPLPQSDRDPAHLQGHWLLARIGKHVLRPGGKKLTEHMLANADIAGKDVVEFAPGLGLTTRAILERDPKSYRGVDRDPQVVDIISKLTSEKATIPASCVQRDAADTGLESNSADVVIGEAMLTMQTERGKQAIIGEAFRLLRAGGTYSIHELGLQPDNLDESVKDEVRKALARSIKVNARPLTEQEWRELLEAEGFEVLWRGKEPMALLDMKRNIADEGIGGVLRILRNVLGNKDIRARVLNMKHTFDKYSNELTGIAFVVRKPEA
ncbi:methyltransferase domain-containing protein [Bifidobacterium breve]|uniref:Methyltransferase domain protein n=1 Tax=Bifidobacterium breve TaxID=1685 RepID=A0A6N2TXQ8_BIFBR|nr:class I SAM-dependent methyltransferase [Bifidobacterium breve]MDB1159253.1 methyltransferase domain-containing protein [Bifidobacterium breve]MDB1169678.1 methyltransferase domain-containing protein [Bifidobacterium breve]